MRVHGKGKRSLYSVFVNVTLSRLFLLAASGSLILCDPCSLHFSKWFFNTSLLVQIYKQY